MIVYEWDGDAMVPLPRHKREADREFVVGLKYTLEAFTPEDQRSRAAHARFFAMVKEYWQNLPERFSAEPWALTEDFLRHYALIKTGYVKIDTYTCGSRAEAVRWASMLPPPVGERGEPVYYLRNVEGSVLTQIRPKSQAYKAMRKAEFLASSDAVLDFLADMVGATAESV